MEACCTSTVSGKFPADLFRHRRGTSVPAYPRIQRSHFYAEVVALSMGSKSPDIITSDPHNRMFIFGMGYVGQFVAQELKKEEWIVSGTCTSITKKKELEEKGFDVYLFDAYKPEWKILDTLRDYSHLLVSIPPALGIGDPVSYQTLFKPSNCISSHYMCPSCYIFVKRVQMLQHEEYLKGHLAGANLKWLCYLSSTSIYGDCKGTLVNEDYSPSPTTKLAEVRLEAEERWLKMGHELGLSSVALRLGGIYGPGRSAIDTILKREPLSERQKRRASRKYTSRVHVADICQALRATIHTPFIRKFYNIVDDDPASRAEVFSFAQQLIEERWPGVISPNDMHLGERPRKEFTAGEKRVSNSRMKEELGVNLLYPSYRMGLRAIIDQIEHLMC